MRIRKIGITLAVFSAIISILCLAESTAGCPTGYLECDDGKIPDGGGGHHWCCPTAGGGYCGPWVKATPTESAYGSCKKTE